MCQVGAVWADWMDRAAYHADTKGAASMNTVEWTPLPESADERAMFDRGTELHRDVRLNIAHVLKMWAVAKPGGSYADVCRIMANEVVKLAAPETQARNGLADEPRSDKKDSAPVVQVVEPLTNADLLRLKGENSMNGAVMEARMYEAVQRESARKWGLSLKENT